MNHTLARPTKPRHNHHLHGTMLLLTVCLSHAALASDNSPSSLQGVAIPVSPGLLDGNAPIVLDKIAAIQLGKALFWDSAIGSDGVACASCHFHAGVDRRTQNQLSTGVLHKKPSGLRFQKTASNAEGGVNYRLTAEDFPLHKLQDAHDKQSAVLFDTDDVVSSSGVFTQRFNTVNSNGDELDNCTPTKDKIFHLGALNTRQVQTRQSPSVINAAFNFRNFWDGRANNTFNGVSPFGARDVNAGVWVTQADGSVAKQALRLENASLASQAVGPVLSATEMSCAQRAFPDVGRKVLTRQPLANQTVHPEDSVLADLRADSGKGLNTTYESLIKTAFAPRYWAGSGDFGKPKASNAAPYQHIEANFSLFFGLALQLYQQTLISDQTPFDSPRLPNTYPQVPSALNEQQARGLKVFLDVECVACHKGPTFSSAVHPSLFNNDSSFESLRLINRKLLNGKGITQAIMDEGYFNLSVTPNDHDLGVGGRDPFGNPLSFTDQYLHELLSGKPLLDTIAVNACDFDSPFFVDFQARELTTDLYMTGSCGSRAALAQTPKLNILQAELKKRNQGRLMSATKGAFKVPSLRNVELTGPYMHNGSLLTLEQVVDFYFRGGNFQNPEHFAKLVFPQPNRIDAQQKADLIAFLKSLTDERVRWEKAPFDHPELAIPHGHDTMANGKLATDLMLTLPAIGKQGRDANLGPLLPFEAYLQP